MSRRTVAPVEERLSFGAIAVTARKSEYQRQRLLRAGSPRRSPPRLEP